jgi:two-component system CheB/CheR fusion protein
VTAGHITLQQEPTDLGIIVQEAVEAVRPELDERGQTLEVRVGEEPVWVNADRIRLVQVFTNLLNNASKFTKKAGQIRIAVEPDGADAIVTVRDTGSGMPAHLLPHIFDLFVQGADSPSRSRGGLGIGLTVVRRLVELHGGTVSAASAGAGHGSEFTVRLPRIEPVPAPPVVEVKERPQSNAHAHRILVVDDNDDAATSLQMLLEQWGHEVSTASDGPSALRMARQFRPDVVLLDIGLPHMDGYEVARRLRTEAEGIASGGTEEGPANGEDRKVQLIAVTGYGQEEDRRRGRSAGFDHHFVKPVDLAALRRLLE